MKYQNTLLRDEVAMVIHGKRFIDEMTGEVDRSSSAVDGRRRPLDLSERHRLSLKQVASHDHSLSQQPRWYSTRLHNSTNTTRDTLTLDRTSQS